ncbi:MAG: hypothetical protein AAF290_01630 [Pseudomonadota bacterium]
MRVGRITKHLKDRDWFSVGIDVVIVIVGVFIGIQVANWNEARQERLSEAQYLVRTADEIVLTLAHIEGERQFASESLEVIEAFAAELGRDDANDAALVAATGRYLSEGAFFANFRPHRTTFDDLLATGNLDTISDAEIRSGLVRLHSEYEEASNVIQSNIEWIQQGEDRIYLNFDAFRFDRRTSGLFAERPAEALAQEIRDLSDVLRRHAAFHYWLKKRSIEVYDAVEPQAQAVLDLIESD